MKALVLLLVLSCQSIAHLSSQPCYKGFRSQDIIFHTTLVREINFLDIGNQQIFGSNTVNLVLLNAFREGEIKGYASVSKNDSLSWNQFLEKIQIFGSDTLSHIALKELTMAELTEDLIFDKQRSDYFMIPNNICILLPANANPRGIQEQLIYFKYADCERIFTKSPMAISLNPLQDGRDINYKEIFLLRLFNSTIVKGGNENSLYFDQQSHSPIASFMAAKHYENKLTERIYRFFNP